MRKIIMTIIFILVSLKPGFGQENIDPDKKYIVTGEQILRWQNHINNLQENVDNLTNDLTEKEIDILVLESKIEKLNLKYEHARKGLWGGLGMGYPLVGQAITIYQFNERFGIFLIGGYNSVWSVNAGIVTKIK